MIKDGWARGRQKWQCAIRERARQAALYAGPEFQKRKKERARVLYALSWREIKRERYEDRKRRGVCTKCEAPLLSDTLCWDCLNDQEARHAVSLGPRTSRR